MRVYAKKSWTNIVLRASVTVQMTQTADNLVLTDGWMVFSPPHTHSSAIIRSGTQAWKHNWIYTYVSMRILSEFVSESWRRSEQLTEGRGTQRWLHFSHYFLVDTCQKDVGAQQAASVFAEVQSRWWEQRRWSPAELHVQRGKLLMWNIL